MNDGKERHGCLTAWLVLMIIGNSLGVLFNLFGGAMMHRALPHAPSWAFPVLGIAAAVNLVCAIALWQWQKWGFYGAVAMSLVALIINLMIGVNPFQAIFGLIGIAILYGVLQIGDGNKGWDQLE